jgi:hypothetical protein
MPFERSYQGFRLSRAPAVFLLVGTPGTGKRAVGHYLAEASGFVHLDFGDRETREGLLGLDDSALQQRLEQCSAETPGVVITWSAGPAEQLNEIRRLRRLGVEPVWLDSDHGAACRAHYGEARRLTRFTFRYIDTFERDGRFRSVEAVARELLAPHRRLIPRWRRRPLPRLVDAAAVLVGAAAATAAVVVAVSGSGSGGASTPATASAAARHVAALPRAGVLVAGSSLAGIRLGDSMATVRALWGSHFTRCCAPGTWFYVYPPPSDPVGAAVEFRHGKVVAVYTLGSPAGWHTQTGIRVGQILENPQAAKGSSPSVYLSCAGYGAKSVRSSSGAVTSILTQGASVYGFALTAPSVSPCH